MRTHERELLENDVKPIATLAVSSISTLEHFKASIKEYKKESKGSRKEQSGIENSEKGCASG